MISESMDLMNRIPGAFFVFDRHTYKFVFVSDGLLNLFGISEKAFLEKYFNSFEMFIYKEDRKLVKETIEGQFDFEDYCEASFRVKSILDDEKYMIFQGRLVVENDGSENVYALLFDMTEMVVSQQEITRMNQDLYNQSTRERVRHDQISRKAQMDGLTGLLNKTAVTETISDYLNESEKDQMHAWFMDMYQNGRDLISKDAIEEVLENTFDGLKYVQPLLDNVRNQLNDPSTEHYKIRSLLEKYPILLKRCGKSRKEYEQWLKDHSNLEAVKEIRLKQAESKNDIPAVITILEDMAADAVDAVIRAGLIRSGALPSPARRALHSSMNAMDL